MQTLLSRILLRSKIAKLLPLIKTITPLTPTVDNSPGVSKEAEDIITCRIKQVDAMLPTWVIACQSSNKDGISYRSTTEENIIDFSSLVESLRFMRAIHPRM